MDLLPFTTSDLYTTYHTSTNSVKGMRHTITFITHTYINSKEPSWNRNQTVKHLI